MQITILGLSITSSWGNGHATTYRGLVRELHRRGHRVYFLERDVPWYATQRDQPEADYCTTLLYNSLDDLRERFAELVRASDAVIVGSYVPEGVAVGEWVVKTATGATAFYDIDTPVTLAKLAKEDYEYLHPGLIPKYDLYLSFTGGPTLERLERIFASPMARPLYCSFDPELYFPIEMETRWDLGYLGTYSADRQPPLDALMLAAARTWSEGRFVVAGPQYPDAIEWPKNVERIDHLAPSDHRAFYNAQRFTQNITRADMIRAGHSPSVRLFEAAACGTPIISDTWAGIEEIFTPGEEILLSRNSDETLRYLRMPEDERRQIGALARERVLRDHTAQHRAVELENYLNDIMPGRTLHHDNAQEGYARVA